MISGQISVIKIRNLLMVTMPPDPDDETVSSLQVEVLQALEKYSNISGLVLDVSTVDTLDSFFARTIGDTTKMVRLMGSKTVVAGMHPSVALTATQLGIDLDGTLSALNVDHALGILERESGL